MRECEWRPAHGRRPRLSEADWMAGYEGLVKRIARRFMWTLQPLGLATEDLYAEGRIAVLRAIRTFDEHHPKRHGAKQSTYVGTCILRQYADLAKKATRDCRGGEQEADRRGVTAEVVEYEDWMLINIAVGPEVEARNALARLRARLPPTQLALLTMRYGYEYEVSELAVATGLSPARVSRELERARRRALRLLAGTSGKRLATA